MKLWAIVFFALPLLGAAYVSWRIWHLLPWGSVVSSVAVALVWLGLALMIGNLVIGLDRMPLCVARAMYAVGYSWPFVMLYLFIIFLVLDLGRLVHAVPQSLVIHSATGTLGIAVLMVTLFVYGNIHYRSKVRVPLTLKTEKNVGKAKKIVLMSDLHLGYHNPRTELARWVDMVNREKADLILIAGDIIDVSVRPLLEEDMATEMRRLNAPVYSCLGNHEYYSGEPKAQQFFKDAGVNLLRDSAVVVDGLCIVGRDDRTNEHRQAIGKVMKQADNSKFTILLDHQPYHLEQAERAGVDFQFSGHTHHGQVWPISWITEAIYEDAFGEHQRGKTQYYVSSGIGIWGGKYRIGTRSEYIVAEIVSNNQ